MLAELNARKSVEALSAIFFLLLFPGFYFYHQGVAAGAVPGALGGFFSPVCLLALIVYAPFPGHWAKVFLAAPRYACLILVFLMWATLSALVTYGMYPWSDMEAAFYQYMNAALTWAALMLVGCGVDFNSRWLRSLLWLTGGIILGMLVFHVLETGSLRYYAAKLHGVEEGVASYQGFARSACILFFALFAVSKSNKQQILVVVSAIFVLFVLSARSEFVAFILSITIFFMVRSKREKKKLIAVFFLGLVTLFTGIAFYEEISQSRQANILDLGSDDSWRVRNELMFDAFRRIGESPVIGGFGGHFESGSQGSYAHNILSVWDSFGVIGFVSYFSLLIIPVMHAFIGQLKRTDLSSNQVVLFMVSVSSLILVLGAKALYWPIPALAWGLYLREKYLEQKG